MKRLIWIAAGLSLCMAAPSGAQQSRNGNMRFQDLDRNGDGVITRDEWRGNDRSFRNQDWNGDGRLSGEEVRPGARRDPSWDQREVVGTSGREFDRTETRFRWLDRDDNGRLSRSEWPTDEEMFARLDRNGDNALTVREFTAQPQRRRSRRTDSARSTRTTTAASPATSGAAAPTVFAALDANRDGVLTRAGGARHRGSHARRVPRARRQRRRLRSSRTSGTGTRRAFDRLDANRDGRLVAASSRTRRVAPPPQPQPQQTATYRAGYERGTREGIQAGREDKPRHWDLEGQRELETGRLRL